MSQVADILKLKPIMLSLGPALPIRALTEELDNSEISAYPRGMTSLTMKQAALSGNLYLLLDYYFYYSPMEAATVLKMRDS